MLPIVNLSGTQVAAQHHSSCARATCKTQHPVTGTKGQRSADGK